MIDERLRQLRKLMAVRGLNAYIVTSSDPHQSEYLADYYKTRQFISGFTGSMGTVVVTRDEAILWVDGRYYVQAAFELQGSEFVFYKQGMPGVKSVYEFLADRVPIGGKIGFDANCISYKLYRELLEKLDGRMLIGNIDFIGEIWKNRPELPSQPVFVHEKLYTGTTAADRIKAVRSEMKARDVEYYLICALDDVAYLFCIRGDDIPCNPVVFSHAIITQDEAKIYINPGKLTDQVREHFRENGVEYRPYEAVVEDLGKIEGKNSVYFDPATTSLSLAGAINANVKLIRGNSIIAEHKAIKNDRELQNQRNAYVKDGVALVKLFNWLEIGAPTRTVTETLVADKLLRFRSEGALFVEPSFNTIAAYGPNASMPHYSATPNHQAVVEPRGLFLLDSGGQYLDGTTDITRTIALGELTEDEILHYTLTLKSHISLITAKFKEGTDGYYLDAFSRLPLWKRGLDYNHGTGHGVGYFLSVHEGPQRIANIYNDIAFKAGMVVSVEPGLYVEGSHGVRIENIVAVRKDMSTGFGNFLSFECLSVCPIDTRPVDVNLLNEDELSWLNAYNNWCREVLSEHLAGSDLEYLERITEPLQSKR